LRKAHPSGVVFDRRSRARPTTAPAKRFYLRDPDGNGVELYRDRPRDEWPRESDGESLAMFTRPLDLSALLAEAE